MSFIRRASAFTVAALLVVTCMMFVIPDSSSASDTDDKVVLIRTGMDGDENIEEIVLTYAKISAEKIHQEDMGRDVYIDDPIPERLDVGEQKLIDDMKNELGKDRFVAVNDPHVIDTDRGQHTDVRHEEPRCSAAPISERQCPDHMVEDDTIQEMPRVDADRTPFVPVEIPEDCESVDAGDIRDIDLRFLEFAMRAAEKDGVSLHIDMDHVAYYLNKFLAILETADLQSNPMFKESDDDCADDMIAVVDDEDDDDEKIFISPSAVTYDPIQLPFTDDPSMESQHSGPIF